MGILCIGDIWSKALKKNTKTDEFTNFLALDRSDRYVMPNFTLHNITSKYYFVKRLQLYGNSVSTLPVIT